MSLGDPAFGRDLALHSSDRFRKVFAVASVGEAFEMGVGVKRMTAVGALRPFGWHSSPRFQ